MNFAVRLVEAWFALRTIAGVVAYILCGLALLALALVCARLSLHLPGLVPAYIAREMRPELTLAHWVLVGIAVVFGYYGLKCFLGALLAVALASGARGTEPGARGALRRAGMLEDR